MATRTSVASGDWATAGTWDGGVPGNGDTAVIANGHSVRFDADESGFANGLALITVNAGGIFHVKASSVTYLKMNGNVDVNGAFYIGERATVSDFTATENRVNVYQVSRTVKTYSVEETLGTPFLAAWNEVMEAAIITENARLRGLDENEMMADEVIAFIETTRASLTVEDYLDYVEDNPESFYHDVANNLLYIHTSDSTNPSTKTITGIEPINRPTAGSENRCTIMFNSTGVFTNTGGGTPILQAYGWHPEREWTQLSGDVVLNATELSALTHSLDIQQGDKVIIGSGTENWKTVEANGGIYTVSSYVSGTKVTTLSAGLGTARLKDDYIARYGRTILIGRSSGTTGIIGSTTSGTFSNIVLVGVMFPKISGLYWTNLGNNWIIRHCTATNAIQGMEEATITDNVFGKMTGSAPALYYSRNVLEYKRNVIINSEMSGQLIANCKLKDSILQNVWGFGDILRTENCILRNCGQVQEYNRNNEDTTIVNCDIKGGNAYSPGYKWYATFKDCIFRNNSLNYAVTNYTGGTGGAGYFSNGSAKLYNCLFESEDAEVGSIASEVLRTATEIIESFDHNQIRGNYKAWMRGGSIETLFTDEDVQPGHLIYKPVSALYPVYRDYPITVKANKIVSYKTSALKDFTGGTVKAEIIDPANDPLIDFNATALETVNMTDVADKTKTLLIRYKSTENKELILRLSVINASGEVSFTPIDYRPFPNLPFIPKFL